MFVLLFIKTRFKEHKMQKIFDKWFLGWRSFQIYSYAFNGRIWMLWKDSFQVSLIAITDQSITTCIKYDSHSFFFSAIYGCSKGIGRRRLQRHLISFQSIILDTPWLLARDFNVTVHPSKRSNLSESHLISYDMKDFIETIIQLSVFDHAFFGPFFT